MQRQRSFDAVNCRSIGAGRIGHRGGGYACLIEARRQGLHGIGGMVAGHAGRTRGLRADSSAPERRGTELGFAVFQQHCVSCHGNRRIERAPRPATLRTHVA